MSLNCPGYAHHQLCIHSTLKAVTPVATATHVISQSALPIKVPSEFTAQMRDTAVSVPGKVICCSPLLSVWLLFLSLFTSHRRGKTCSGQKEQQVIVVRIEKYPKAENHIFSMGKEPSVVMNDSVRCVCAQPWQVHTHMRTIAV